MQLNPQQIEQIEAEISRQPDYVQHHYYMMVAKGESPRFAAMCAMRKAPETRYSDRTFNASRQEHMNGMLDWQREAYLKMAKRAGIATQGKYYVGGLGRPTDPEAWVSTVDDVKEVCKRKRLTSDGLVRHESAPASYPRKPLAEDVCKTLVERRIKADPSLAAKCKADPKILDRVKSEVLDRHTKPYTSTS